MLTRTGFFCVSLLLRAGRSHCLCPGSTEHLFIKTFDDREASHEKGFRFKDGDSYRSCPRFPIETYQLLRRVFAFEYK